MTNDSQSRPHSVLWKYLRVHFSKYLEEKTSDIDHQDVISDLAGRAELSASYIYSIIFANLIALFGLLTNSVAVVIGAMLISPLMGPIFSLGLAFSIGDLRLTRRAVRNIIFSVVLTIAVAALFTVISPLKTATQEILSRTRPNIYDMLIAVFAGTAGALAICTRKNYLFTTTGVAVATAVIPPLSVVGFGVGTWQIRLAAGGFLLFFTNLVAIVISSNFIFHVLKFRGSMAEEPNYTARRRFQILGTLLVIISIPLVITLVTDIRKVKLTGRVEAILKTSLNRQLQSRLTKVSIIRERGKLLVAASLNTVKYVDSDTQKTIEAKLTDQLGIPAQLELEQIIVRSGTVDPTAALRSIIPVSSPVPDSLATLREKALALISEGCRDIESFITPFKVSGCSITFSEQKVPLGIAITIARDYLPDAQELQWLTRVFEKKLGEKIDLKVDNKPFLPEVSFTDNNEIDENSRKAMAQLKQIFAQSAAYRLILEIPESGHRSTPTIKHRTELLKEYLVKELSIPIEFISVKNGSTKMFRVKLLRK